MEHPCGGDIIYTNTPTITRSDGRGSNLYFWEAFPVILSENLCLPTYRALYDFSDPRRKTKIGTVENIPTFLRRSDIGQFVTCDELILPWRRRGGGSSRVWFVPG